MTKGEAPSTSGISRARAITSSYSSKSRPYFMTSTCALTPSTLSRNSIWKPLVIDITASSAATPRATPATAMKVMTETVFFFFERR